MKRFSRLVTPISKAARWMSGPSTAKPTLPKSADVDDVVSLFEKHPELIPSVINSMSPENRRKLVVTGGAIEWFGEANVAAEVQLADFDKDRVISPKDFDRWFEEALRRKTSGPTADGKTAPTDEPTTSSAANVVPMAVLLIVGLEAALPFVGFGFLDNATMIIAGDAIDRTVGFYFNTSVMASAAMGNVVSGCMGMQVHGVVEKLVQRLSLPIPPMTEEQRRSNRVFMAGHIGGTVGVACGLLLGMVPLMFVGGEEEKNELRIFTFLDTNGDGKLNETELARALIDMGLPTPGATAATLILHHGTDNSITFDQFQSMLEHVKRHNASLATK